MNSALNWFIRLRDMRGLVICFEVLLYGMEEMAVCVGQGRR